eukprot:gene10898-12701_t
MDNKKKQEIDAYVKKLDALELKRFGPIADQIKCADFNIPEKCRLFALMMYKKCLEEPHNSNPSYFDMISTTLSVLDDIQIKNFGKGCEAIPDPLREVIMNPDVKGSLDKLQRSLKFVTDMYLLDAIDSSYVNTLIDRMFELMRSPNAKEKFTDRFTLFILVNSPMLTRCCDKERLNTIIETLKSIGTDDNVPKAIREDSLSSAVRFSAAVTQEHTHEKNEFLEAYLMRIVVRCAGKNFASSECATGIYAKFISTFAPYLPKRMAIDLATEIQSKLKDNLLCRPMIKNLFTRHAAEMQKMELNAENEYPLPKQLARAGYTHPVLYRAPFAMFLIPSDDVDTFKMIFDVTKMPEVYPSILDVALFSKAINIATYLMTTPILKYSYPLWWLALGDKYQIAQKVLFSKTSAKYDRQLVSRVPKNAASISEVIMFYKNKAFLDDCYKHGYLELSPADKADNAKNEGNTLYTNGKFKEAIVCYSRALEIGGPSHLVHTNRSVAYFRLGDFEKSLNDAEEAIKLEKSWVKAYLRKGDALKSLSRFQESIDAYQLGLTYDNKHQEILKNLDDAKKKKIEDDLTKSFNVVEINVEDCIDPQ